MIKEDVLVTVIIPAYNVCKYVEKCVESVLSQKYKNFELIIVDDGSVDSTREILNGFEKKDSRVKVLWQKNAGVSAARNAGIDIARGKYIVFVDADDYVAENYLDYLVSIVEKNDVDFGISTKCFVRENEKQILDDRILVLDAEHGTALLLSPYVYVGCWNKIYRTELLNKYKIRFKKCLFFGEGLNFIIQVSQRCNGMAVGGKKVYFYRRNNDSSATTNFSIKKLYNGIASLNDIEANLLLKTPLVTKMLNLHKTLFRLMAVTNILQSGTAAEHKDFFSECLCCVRRHTPKILIEGNVPIKSKMMLLLCSISPFCMSQLSYIKRKIAKLKSV